MSRRVLKVIGITTLAIVIAFAFVVMGIAVLSPSTMAKTYDNMGLRYRSKLYAEKAYEKDGSINSLVMLVNVSIKSGDNSYTEKYAGELISNGDFQTYLDTLSSGNEYYDFITSNYIKSAYIGSTKTTAEICNLAMSYSTEYRKNNAVEALILVAYEKPDKFTLSYVLNVLKDFDSSKTCPSASQARLDEDVKNLTTLIDTME